VRRALVVLLFAICGAMVLDQRAVQDAIDIAHTSLERTRTRFHADYRFVVARAPADFVEIVTPFRRVVIAAETGVREGRRIFGQRDAAEALGPDRERVEVYVELTFHPLNTFVGVPDFGVTLTPTRPGAQPVRPAALDRIPRLGPRVGGQPGSRPSPYPIPPSLPGGGQPLSGGTLIAGFDGRSLDPKGLYDVTVTDPSTPSGSRPKELASVRVDFSRLR
jgi:hypothetical protein